MTCELPELELEELLPQAARPSAAASRVRTTAGVRMDITTFCIDDMTNINGALIPEIASGLGRFEYVLILGYSI